MAGIEGAARRPAAIHRPTGDLTRGRAGTAVLGFALPLIVSNILQILYHSVDTFFVGYFMGTNHLAAVSVGGPVMSLMIMVLGGVSSGVSVVISHNKGAGQSRQLSEGVGASITLYLILAVAVTGMGLAFINGILGLLQTPDEAWDAAREYLTVIFCGTPFLFGYNLVGALQRGLGNSKSSMYYVMISSLVNIVLDAFFVGALRMGALGAALGTVIAQGCAFAQGLFQLMRTKEGGKPLLGRLGLYRQPLKQILRIGAPTALNEILVSLAMFTVGVTANSFGVAASAAYGVGRTVDGIAIVSDGAMNSAMAAFASRNVGAGKPERAAEGLRAALLFSGAIGLCMMPVVWLVCPWLAALFDPNPAVTAAAVDYLRRSAFSYVFFALVGPLIGFTRGTGNQMPSVIIGLIAQYGFRVPVTLIAAHFLGFPGTAYGILAGPVSSVCMYGVFIASKKWRKGISNLEG